MYSGKVIPFKSIFGMRILAAAIAITLFTACSSKENNPDVSHIKVNLETRRFDQDFFKIDSNRFAMTLDRVIAAYPSFGERFLFTILNADPTWPADSTAMYVRAFQVAYRNIFDSAQKVFADFSPYEKQIEKSVQYLKHYFPQYKAPTKIITYVGPLDGYGEILDVDAFIIGLQHHLGANFSLYKTDIVQATYPGYVSAGFTPESIVINCMKNVVSDMYRDERPDASLVVQMVEKGKRLYLLKRLVPNAKEHKLIGYTQQQYNESKERENIIWAMFVQNNLLQSKDVSMNKNFIGESPKTAVLGESAPGNIGSFAGWQIVNTYMEKYPATTLDGLMKMDAEKLFEAAKYKP